MMRRLHRPESKIPNRQGAKNAMGEIIFLVETDEA